MSRPSECVLCTFPLNDGTQTRVVKKKGINTLIAKSKDKQDNKWKILQDVTEIEIHELCRMNYVLCKKKPSAPPALRDPEEEFDFTINCFLCGKSSDPIHKKVRLVATEQLQATIRMTISDRNDEWGEQVSHRIGNVCLRDVHARYHALCYNNFKRLPSEKPQGRPQIADLESAFQNVCKYMEECDDSQFTMSELMDKLETWTCTVETLKKKLKNKYKEDIVFWDSPGQPTIVCFSNTGYTIVKDCWYQKRAGTEAEERLRIVRTAADIIREDIRNKPYEVTKYPPPSQLFDNIENDIPETLKCFLDEVLLKGMKSKEEKLKRKRNSIAHSIISCVRPRKFISSIQLATGVYLNRKFGSRLMIDVLNSLGFCASYTDVNLYETSAVMNHDKKIEETAYVQFVFDNADHNVCTLEGLNTFHSMGGICCVTPRSGVTQQGEIAKLAKVPKSTQLAAKVNVTIEHYSRTNASKDGLKSVTFLDVSQLELGDRPQLPTAYSLHIWAKKLNIENIPSWRGFMETVSHDSDYDLSQIICLPFVNLPPSDMDTINTVLYKAAREAQTKGQGHVFVTFDHPLYIKARSIVASDELLSGCVIVRLGTFHLLMSALGAIGTIMDGSGLKELLCLAYASNSVDHMLTGHAFSRAIRGHLLIYTALGALIAEHAENVNYEDRMYITELLCNFSDEPTTLKEINEDEKLLQIRTKMLQVIDDLAKRGRTSRLWIQYFHCITLVMQFIEAERLGNWELHLQGVRDMLPIFHAAGHLAYAKSAQIYLQDMAQLPSVLNPQEFQKFVTQGQFTIRRSDKKWAGIFSDQTVEQTLMRLLSVNGGLTSGRGINKEGVLAKWILAMPVAYEVMDGFEQFSGVRSATSEQHTDMRPTRMKRDTEDCVKFAQWFTEHDPFSISDPDTIMSIADGLCGGDAVNCDKAFEIGENSMKTVIGSNAADVKLKRTAKVKSIATTKRGIVVNDDVVAVNTTLLFQRITAVTKSDSQLATRALQHELAPFPLSLFDEHGTMRKSKKSELFNVFTSQSDSDIDLGHCQIVVDGGYLLHKVMWPVGSTYQQILQLYEDYIIKSYGKNVIVVFDGYKQVDMGLKSYERLRRAKVNMGTAVLFEKDMTLAMNQSKFLSNDKNKDRLIDFLAIQLKNAGIAVKQASEDADLLIATTAIEQLDNFEKVAVIGQDVDLLVLLIALTPAERDIYFIKQGSGRISNKLFSTQQHAHIRETILFCHAFTGCDTTSSIFQKGKKSLLNILEKKKQLKSDVFVFNRPNSTKEEIQKAGERLMLALYKAPDNAASINDYRYERFAVSTARLTTEVRLAQLPPTAGATVEHVYRVYLQVQKWLGNELNPLDWGWSLKNQIFMPTMTKVPPAPESIVTYISTIRNTILKMIHCNCKGSCSNRCGCRKAGLKCSSICSGCHGNSCTNTMDIDLTSDISEDSSNSVDALLQVVDDAITQQVNGPAYDEDTLDDAWDIDNLPVFRYGEDCECDEGTATKKQRVE